MKAKKKLKEYLTKSVRKIKHRKGYGVHSPFAYTIITEVIEEKLPYYSYQSMLHIYGKDAPINFKTACLYFRLANRFQSRRVLEVGCDGGYSLLPLLLVDRGNAVTTMATRSAREHLQSHLQVFSSHFHRLSFIDGLESVAEGEQFDMILINSIPEGMDTVTFFGWVMNHSTEKTVCILRDILPDKPLEMLWDQFCDCDDVSITMDLFDKGLVIRRPRFFKQHYVVSF